MMNDIFSYPVTQSFGVPDMSISGHHTGVDLGLPEDTPVPAEGTGVVETTFVDQYGGKQVKVKYASGAEGWFAHLAAIFVQPGQAVAPTTEIGVSGHTGDATGPHLHFEERSPSGQLIDPFAPASRTYIGGLADPTGSTAGDGKPFPAPANGCPAGWHRGNMGGAGMCVPDGLQFGGGDPGTNITNAAKSVLGPIFSDAQRAIVGLAIGGAIVVAVAVVGFSGVKRTLD